MYNYFEENILNIKIKFYMLSGLIVTLLMWYNVYGQDEIIK